MDSLNTDTIGKRLFTYKVASDGGSAPNPFGNICTLAICKPKIRSNAGEGDIIVGLDTGRVNERRIVYCMEVSKVLTWHEYIGACHAAASTRSVKKGQVNLGIKVPKNAKHPGDCIWPNAGAYSEALPSWSTHEGQLAYETDVTKGKNVLLGQRFWYFGDGAKFKVELDAGLKPMIPGRGHKSNANAPFRDEFVECFNRKLEALGIGHCGIHGAPKFGPGVTDDSQRAKCRAAERKSDQFDEEN
jgi:hypothetical protein